MHRLFERVSAVACRVVTGSADSRRQGSPSWLLKRKDTASQTYLLHLERILPLTSRSQLTVGVTRCLTSSSPDAEHVVALMDRNAASKRRGSSETAMCGFDACSDLGSMWR
jgi:hypothetical protein